MRNNYIYRIFKSCNQKRVKRVTRLWTVLHNVLYTSTFPFSAFPVCSEIKTKQARMYSTWQWWRAMSKVKSEENVQWLMIFSSKLNGEVVQHFHNLNTTLYSVRQILRKHYRIPIPCLILFKLSLILSQSFEQKHKQRTIWRNHKLIDAFWKWSRYKGLI